MSDQPVYRCDGCGTLRTSPGLTNHGIRKYCRECSQEEIHKLHHHADNSRPLGVITQRQHDAIISEIDKTSKLQLRYWKASIVVMVICWVIHWYLYH